MPDKKIKVSVVIVNFNGKDLLKIILDSIKGINFGSFEIIVVDNNSSDGSKQFIRKNYKNVILVENKENIGYCGINSALKHCKGKYIFFLNNDMKLDKNCLKSMVKAIEADGNIAMAAPALANFYNKKLKSNGTWVSRAFYNGHIKGNNPDAVREIPYMGVGLIRKSFVEMYGYLFDRDYFVYAEDLDLGLRIRLSGMKTVFVPDAIIYHVHAATTQKAKKSFNTFLMERNLLETFLKIFSIKRIALFLPYVLFARIIAIVKDILALKISIALSRIKAIAYVAMSLKSIIEKRKLIQKFRKADDSYILKVFDESYLFKPKFIV
ncbi:glycosyltransferase family 2 protein [Candidatus Woesearchaeota archaeon]|nr:glycosyltransferase family 2 protein [Candidatus Woesearchaeota archaeon]